MDKNTTVVFPSPLMSTIEEIGAFLRRGSVAARATSTSAQGSEGAPATADEDSPGS